MTRRDLMASALAFGAAAWLPVRALAHDGAHPFQLTEAEWRERLTPAEYRVLREEDTEPAYSSALNAEDRPGLFHCKGCDAALYSSEAKFDSGTGWPSFTEALDGAIGTKPDRKLLVMVRTECHCARCGGHLGHIFDDGPEPTGKRHCINGLALTFVPEMA